LYLADHLSQLLPPDVRPGVRVQSDTTTDRSVRLHADETFSDRESAILGFLRAQGASFFAPLHEAAGGGYPADTLAALWNLVWRGAITNDTFHALRAFTHARAARRKARRVQSATAFRSRRLAPPSAEGRWSLVAPPGRSVSPSSRAGRERAAGTKPIDENTRWAAAMTQQLLTRHGVLTREAVLSENIPGGFGTVYPVLKGLEDNGRIRRGYFVAGLGATQFAMPGALDLLRSLRDSPDEAEVAALAATDPANPYGATLKYPEHAGRTPTRSVGSIVILVDGAMAAYLARGERVLTTFLPDTEPERSRVARAIATALVDRARGDQDEPRAMLIEEVDGVAATQHAISRYLIDAGFAAGAMGMQLRSRPATFAHERGAVQSDVVTDRPPRNRSYKSVVSSPFARRYFDEPDPKPPDE